ncbi:MAG: hypothetical protein WA366_21890 [Pseudolabrys sp.]
MTRFPGELGIFSWIHATGLLDVRFTPERDMNRGERYVCLRQKRTLMPRKWSKFATIKGNSHFRKRRIKPSYLIVRIYFCVDLLRTEYRYVGGAHGNQMKNATFLFVTGYFTRLCLSSDLIPLNYKAPAKNSGVSGHRNLVAFFHEHLVAIPIIGGPGAVQVKCVGRTVEHYAGAKQHLRNRF